MCVYGADQIPVHIVSTEFTMGFVLQLIIRSNLPKQQATLWRPGLMSQKENNTPVCVSLQKMGCLSYGVWYLLSVIPIISIFPHLPPSPWRPYSRVYLHLRGLLLFTVYDSWVSSAHLQAVNIRRLHVKIPWKDYSVFQSVATFLHFFQSLLVRLIFSSCKTKLAALFRNECGVLIDLFPARDTFILASVLETQGERNQLLWFAHWTFSDFILVHDKTLCPNALCTNQRYYVLAFANTTW